MFDGWMVYKVFFPFFRPCDVSVDLRTVACSGHVRRTGPGFAEWQGGAPGLFHRAAPEKHLVAREVGRGWIIPSGKWVLCGEFLGYMGWDGVRWGLTIYYIYIDMYMGGLCGLRSAIKKWKILESGTNFKPCWKMIWILQDSDMLQARTSDGAFQCSCCLS